MILGASAWPEHPQLGVHASFANSAKFFAGYLRQHGIGDVLNLFDTKRQPNELLKKIRTFLGREKPTRSKTIVFYYVGHGGVRDGNYLLSLRCTTQDDLEISSLPIREVSKVLYDLASDKRHIIILDACYAGAAERDFVEMNMNEAASLMQEQLREALKRIAFSHGLLEIRKPEAASARDYW